MRVAGIALRTAEGGPMREVKEAAAEVDGGLVGDMPKKKPRRGVTFLSASQWRDVTRELDAELPWHTRRANVLIEGCDSLASLIGKRIQIGETLTVQIHDETNPCGMMEDLHRGLMKTLVPDCRGGVFGQVLTAGPVRVGDAVRVDE